MTAAELITFLQENLNEAQLNLPLLWNSGNPNDNADITGIFIWDDCLELHGSSHPIEAVLEKGL